jgi:hypothetical protein
VTLTLIARRKSVVSSSSDGKALKSSGRGRYSVATTTASATLMFSVIARSRITGGSGTIIMTTTSTITPAARRSEWRPMRLRSGCMVWVRPAREARRRTPG